MRSKTTLTAVAAFLSLAISASAQIYFSDDFSADTTGSWSIGGDAQVGDLSFDSVDGNPAGSLLLTGVNQGNGEGGFGGQAYFFDSPDLDFSTVTEDTEVTISFDAKLLGNVGVFVAFNADGLANQSLGAVSSSEFEPLSFDVTIPGSATTFDFQFFMGVGAFDGAAATLAIDNIVVSGPDIGVIPEPSAAAGLFGLAAIGFASIRRRR